MEIAPGLRGEAHTLVEREDSAQAVGSGDLLVYATPCLVALMEGAAFESIAPYLEAGQSSVGISMVVSHSAATPVGMQVRAESTVTAVDGNKITFDIAAFDEAGKIGSATHVRAVIHRERFLEKTYEKI